MTKTYCSFCGRESGEVRIIIVNKDAEHAAICDICVLDCIQMIWKDFVTVKLLRLDP